MITVIEPWADRMSEIDVERARRYGREDYWNSIEWRKLQAGNWAYSEQESWHENHKQEVDNRFFAALREKAPDLFNGATITLPMLKKREQAFREAVLAVGCRPTTLRSASWWRADIRITKGANQHFEWITFRLEDDYDGPDWLPLPRRPKLEETKPELFIEGAVSFQSDRELHAYMRQ